MALRSRIESLRNLLSDRLFSYFSEVLSSHKSSYFFNIALYCLCILVHFIATVVVIVCLKRDVDVKSTLDDPVARGLFISYVVVIAPGLITWAAHCLIFSPLEIYEMFSQHGWGMIFQAILETNSKTKIFFSVLPLFVNFILVGFYFPHDGELSERNNSFPTLQFAPIFLILLVQTIITTAITIFFIFILIINITTIRNNFENSHHNFVKLLPRCSFSATDWEDEIRRAGDRIEEIQEMLRLINKDFTNSVTLVNFLICSVNSILCLLGVIRANNLLAVITYFLLTIDSFGLILATCIPPWWLMNVYDDLLFAIRRLSLLERWHPGRLPYSELNRLQELLRSSPLQVVTLGRIPVGLRLGFAIIGLVLTYTVLLDDLANLNKLCTKANDLTDFVGVTDTNN